MLGKTFRRLECRHRAWRYRVRQDPEEIAWLRKVLAPGDLAVDVGAYKGGYTHWMRHAVGSSGRVLAFEPQPELADFLGRMVDAFGWSNVHVEEAALSDASGEARLHAPKAQPSQRASLLPHGDQDRRYAVRLDTLDACLARLEPAGRVALIKCDVEGHELEVFRGATRTLARDRPKLLFECEARHVPDRTIAEVFDHLRAIGYEGHFFWQRRLLPVSEFDAEVHQVPTHKPYANNFVFEHAGRFP